MENWQIFDGTKRPSVARRITTQMRTWPQWRLLDWKVHEITKRDVLPQDVSQLISEVWKHGAKHTIVMNSMIGLNNLHTSLRSLHAVQSSETELICATVLGSLVR